MRFQVLIFVQRMTPCRSNVGSSQSASSSKTDSFTLDKYSYKYGVMQHVRYISSPDEVNLDPNSTYELIEAWKDTEDDPPEGMPEKLFVDAHNLDVVRKLFPRRVKIDYRTRFSINLKQFLDHEECSVFASKETLRVLEKILRSGVTITYRHLKDGTLAHFAAERGGDDLIQLLVRRGVDLNAERSDGCTPLIVAVMKENMESTLALLSHGASVNGRSTDGSTALHFAIQAKWLKIVKTLVGKRADVNAKTEKGWTPLHAAAEWGDERVISMLLKAGAKIDPKGARGKHIAGMTPLLVALKHKKWKAAMDLVRNGANVEAVCAKGRGALYFVTEEGDFPTKIVKLLLDHGADPNVRCGPENSFTPIALAVDARNSNIVELLLSKGTVVHDRPELLRAALKSRACSVMILLLANGCAVDWAKEKAVAHVILKSCSTCVWVLMKYGASFHFRDIVLDRELGENWKPGYSSPYISRSFLEDFLAFGFDDLDDSAESALNVLLWNSELKSEPCSESKRIANSRSTSEDEEDSQFTKDELGKTILRHLVKLKVAGKAVGDILDEYDRFLNVDAFSKKCEAELERMKTEILEGTVISVHDILMKPTDWVARLFRRNNFRRAFRRWVHELKGKFPAYAKIIKCRAMQGKWRHEFLVKGLEGFNWLTVRLPALPYDVRTRIVNLLDRQDLIHLDVCFKAKKLKSKEESEFDQLDLDFSDD